jgi:hypothetical protein
MLQKAKLSKKSKINQIRNPKKQKNKTQKISNVRASIKCQ